MSEVTGQAEFNSYGVDGEELISDKVNALRNHADVFGRDLFEARNRILEDLEAIGADQARRAKLGTVRAARFEQFAALSPQQRDTALSLADEAMNLLIKDAAYIIGASSRPYPGGYVIEYQIEATVCELHVLSAHRHKLKPVAKQKLLGDDRREFAGSFGRWLNKFGARRSGKATPRDASRDDA